MAIEKFSSKCQAWFCTTGLPSDVVVEVDDMTFHLHKFPLMSKSKKLNDLISEQEATLNSSEKAKDGAEEDGTESEIELLSCHLTLRDFPGGSEAFEVAAKFCYDVKIDFTAANAAPLRCAGEVLEMTEDYSEDNLISRTERFLSKSVFRTLKDSIKALKSCESVIPMAEDLGLVQRCIDAISSKAALVDPSLFGWPVNESRGRRSRSSPAIKAASAAEPWFEELSVLCSDLFNRALEAMKEREVSSDVIENCLLYYAKKCFPGMSRSSMKPATSSSSSIASEGEQRELLETIVASLPTGKSSSSSRATKLLFGLLRTANILSSSEACKRCLEHKIGTQLEQASLDDLLIPSYSYLNETLYDVECVERMLGYFLDSYGGQEVEEGDDFDGSSVMVLVGKLIDRYLSEIASDSNLKPDKFCSLAMSLPDQARLFDDGLYRAVDVYIKAHPWISETERENICGVMDCRKLTMEACTHAAQNERLPLRAVVQVLFFEQLQLRNAIAGTLIEGNELSIQANAPANKGGRGSTWRAAVRENQVLRLDMDTVRNRVHELERECSTMKKVMEKIDPPSNGWKSSLSTKFGCKFKTQVCDSHQEAVVQGVRGRNAASHPRHRNH
ncbi:hypothetical protein V2J09_016512 [Rumex salicifolius]